MRATAFEPAPPTPITLIRAPRKSSCMSYFKSVSSKLIHSPCECGRNRYINIRPRNPAARCRFSSPALFRRWNFDQAVVGRQPQHCAAVLFLQPDRVFVRRAEPARDVLGEMIAADRKARRKLQRFAIVHGQLARMRSDVEQRD